MNKRIVVISLLLLSEFSAIFALSSLNSSIRIRVCEGCESKCRGTFTPQSSFTERINNNIDMNSDTNDVEGGDDNKYKSIDIEKVYCMNQCKRGPNVRLIKNDQVLTVSNGLMNDTEMKRKTFQSVVNDDRVDQIWGIVEEISNGCEEIDWVEESGHVDKLTDLS